MKERGKKKPETMDVRAAALQEKLQRGEALAASMLAVSRAGHDKDNLYVVLDEDGTYLWLADGKRRTLASPKKKKKMHVQLIKHIPEEISDQMQEIRLDAHLRSILKSYETRNEKI